MIQILREDERLALFSHGQYQGLKGPGIVVCLPFLGTRVRLRVGDVGILMTYKLARFGDATVPVAGEELSGSWVRIVGFNDLQSPSCPRVEQHAPSCDAE